MVEVVIFLGPITYPPINLISVHTGMMEDFGHSSVISQHPPCNHCRLGFIQLIIMLVLHLVFHMLMIKVVWFIGPPTFPPINFIVGLVVLIFCCVRVVIIFP